MNSRLVVPLVAAVVLTGLTACSGGDSGPLGGVTWQDGEDGGAPTLAFEAPLEVTDPVYRVIKKGDGPPAAPGTVAMVNYVSYDGVTGEVTGGTYASGAPAQYLIPAKGSPEAVGSPLYEAIADRAEGSEVLVAFLQANEETQQGDPVLLGLTVQSVKKTSVIEPAGPNLPTVTLVDGGKPLISIPEEAAPPADLVSQVLVEGDGAEIAEGDSVTVNDVGWIWADGSQFASSWEIGVPDLVDLTADAEGPLRGWVKGLVGKKVGSQVLLIIPPALGFGDEAQGEQIPADSTLVFVIEVLGADS
jgi:peptidylprolyl isomerase